MFCVLSLLFCFVPAVTLNLKQSKPRQRKKETNERLSGVEQQDYPYIGPFEIYQWLEFSYTCFKQII